MASIRPAMLALSLFAVLSPGRVEGQGFGVYEQGTCAMARGGAGVAEPCDDGSAIYLNPAGLVGRQGITISGGGTVIFGSGTFDGDDGSRTAIEGSTALAPHFYVRYAFNDRLAIGGGLYVPYGLGIRWPLDFAGRFVSYDASLQTAYVQPTLAYALTDAVSVGGGLAIAIGSVELNRREDLATVPLGTTGLSFGSLVDPRTDFATTTLSASGATGVGASLGILIKANDRLRIGARYLTAVELTYEGDARFEPVAGSFRVTKPNPLGLPVGTPLDAAVAQVFSTLQDQSARTGLEMPAQLVAGVSARATSRLTLFADYHWVGWSAFDSVTLDFSQPIPPDEGLIQNYRDTSAVRIGADVEARPGLQLRAGYAYNQAAAPDETVTPLLPEASRNHFTAGLGWTPRANLTLDLAYQFVRHADRRGRVVNPPPGEAPTVALNSGLYRSRADLLGFTLTYRR